MSRIAYAQFDRKRLTTLRAKVLNAVNGFIREACDEAGVSRGHLYKIVVVGNTCNAPRLPRNRHEPRGPRPLCTGDTPAARPAGTRAAAQERTQCTGLPPADRRGLRRRRYRGLHARDAGLRQRRDSCVRRHRHQRRSGHGEQGQADGVLGAGRTRPRGCADPTRDARSARRHREGTGDRLRRVSSDRQTCPRSVSVGRV